MAFVPTSAELQHPLAQEYQNNAGDLATPGLQEDASRRGHSGSQWGIMEANAVRAVPLVDLDPTRIIPKSYFPKDDNKVFYGLFRHIRAATPDDLKEYDPDKFLQNPYLGFFKYLAELGTTNTPEESVIRAHQRNTSVSSVTTELSTSSNEDSHETVSTAALREFVDYTMMHMGTFKDLRVPAREGRKKPHLSCSVDPVRFRFRLGGVSHDVVNDGQLAVNFRGSVSGSDRKSRLSVVNIECKPRHAGGLKRRSGEPEPFSPIVFAQEVAEMIGAVFAQYQMQLPFKHKTQESFVLSMHGTNFYVSTAHFSAEYMQYLQTGSYPGVTGGNFLWVRRSVHFDLKNVDDRGEALRLLWALITYVVSGMAEVNIVSSAIQEASV